MEKYIKDLVSVIIPTFKRSDMLERAIKSVLQQTYTKIEVLVINDNEPNDEWTIMTRNRITLLDDPRIRFIIQEKHINGAAARNFGINQAKGEYISFLDDDDYFEEEKISIQLDVLRALSKDFGGVSCLFKKVSNNKHLYSSLPYKDGNIYKEIMNLNTDVTTCSLLLRHECIDAAGYFDETLSRHQDIQFLTQFTYKFKIKLIKKYLVNIDISDTQNRPDFTKLKNAKKCVYESIKYYLDLLSPKEKKIFFLLHDFELSYIEFKKNNIFLGFVKSLAVIKSINAFRSVIIKIYRIILGKLIRKKLLKHFNGSCK